MAKTIYCAKCGKRLDDEFLMVQDNFLQVKYFDDPDGLDNAFCSSECLMNALSVATVEMEGL